MRRLLILGGTAEAAALARALSRDAAGKVEVITSLAGRLPVLPDLPGQIRVGGFGGAEGLARYLGDARIDLLIDATHPFAAAISVHAAEACRARTVPRLMLVRAPWPREPGDRWHEVAGFAEAAALLPALADRIWLTTGAGGIAAFAPLPDAWFLVRLFAPPAVPLPLPRSEIIVARPPFTVFGERTLLVRYRIGALVAKNSGGPTAAKLAAARAEGIPVVMLRRPPLPAGERVESVAEALTWLRARA